MLYISIFNALFYSPHTLRDRGARLLYISSTSQPTIIIRGHWHFFDTALSDTTREK